MPQFTQWNVPNPFPNILYNPAAVDAAIAKTQSELGNLDINRRELALKENKFAQGLSLGDEFAKNIDGTTGTSSADVTPFEQKMGLAEGGTDPTVVNKQGYAGQFQFGSERLADLGLYTPAPGEGKNGWKGKFHIAPYNVANLQDFLTNPAAQHAAFVAHVADIDKAIANTPGADKFDQNGLRAVAHLGGVGGMRAFIASGGNLNSQDANGTSLKNYYQRFASGGPAALQQAFGSVHGPGGPPGSAPAVQPGGNVSTAWVDPNAPLPVPPIPPAGGPPPAFNPNTGPRVAGASPAGAPDAATVAPGALPPAAAVGTDDPNALVSYPPVVTGQADETVPVEPSRLAMRLGGTDTAGPGAGQATAPPDVQPNRMAYGTGLPGVTIGLPTNGLAPPPTAAAPTTAAAPPVAPAPATAPPPAPSRVIQREPLIQSGMARGLTRDQALNAARLFKSGADPAAVLQHIDQLRHQNDVIRQGDATQAAIDEKENYARRKAVEQTAFDREEKAKADAIAAAAEKRAADKEARAVAKEAEEQKARIKGDAIAAQHENTLLDGTESGETNTAKYASAYSKFAEGRYNADGSFVKPNMTAYAKPTFIPPGATEVPDYGKQETPGPLPPPAVMTGMQGNVSGIKNINQVLRELDAHPNSVGMKALQGEWALQYTDPEGIALRAGIADILSQTFHDRSGASVTISESPRLKPFVPAPTDTVAALRTKLERLRGIYREVLEDNYSVYGPEGTGRSLPVIERTLKQTPKASDKTDAATVKPPPKGSKVIIP